MRFEIAHDFEAPLDAIELAVLSPDLGPLLAESLSNLEFVKIVRHEIVDGALHRTLRFQATAPLPFLRGYNVAREAMTWDEKSTYRLADHTAHWSVEIRPEWQRYFRSEGTYWLESPSPGQTRRVVSGVIEVNVKLLRLVAERVAVSEVRRTYAAEADTLRRLSTV